MTETINGLLTQKPGRDPQQGETKLFTVEQRKGKSGKPYIKIKNATAEQGGQPYRILNVEQTEFVDQHGNISFNVELETSNVVPTAFQQAKATMSENRRGDQQGGITPDELDDAIKASTDYIHGKTDSYKREDWPDAPTQSPPAHPNGHEGINATRKHLMQSANLLVLCIRAAEKAVAPHQPVVAQTSEQFQSDVAKLFIEASSRRTTDGVHWWSYIDKMPEVPIQ